MLYPKDTSTSICYWIILFLYQDPKICHWSPNYIFLHQIRIILLQIVYSYSHIDTKLVLPTPNCESYQDQRYMFGALQRHIRPFFGGGGGTPKTYPSQSDIGAPHSHIRTHKYVFGAQNTYSYPKYTFLPEYIFIYSYLRQISIAHLKVKSGSEIHVCGTLKTCIRVKIMCLGCAIDAPLHQI